MHATIDYYFSLSSPWSYLGLKRLRSFAERSGSKINYRPMVMAKIFAATGGLPLAQRPKERRAYRLTELDRWSFFLDTPLVREPAFFPVDDVLATHTILAALDQGSGDVGDLCDALHRVIWVRSENLADEAVIKSTVEDCGFSASLVDAAKSGQFATSHEENTQSALDAGVFGAPSYIIDGELFWGQDRLDFVGRKLGLRH